MATGWLLWGGFVGASAVTGAVIVRTRWLQSRTLEKSVFLSVVFHGVLAAFAAMVGGTRPASWGTADEGPMTMTVVVAEEPADEPRRASVADDAAKDGVDAPLREPSQQAEDEMATEAAAAAGPPEDFVPLLEAAVPQVAETPAQITEAVAQAEPPASDEAPASGDKHRAVPALYSNRIGARRSAAAAAHGGSEETERAVEAALSWLAAAQSPDGRWNAAAHGGGVERTVDGHHRHGAGAKSDHGVTGLALLAFLGAGRTHRDGPHAGSVSRGLRYLVDRQKPDGSLAGEAEFFAALYCHGMATIALAEACALTADDTLLSPLERAVRYTLAMQSPATGGWRYAAGDRGDTSQLGWQVMVLVSARQAGIAGLERAEAGARSFLGAVSSGRSGGLAGYRPGERPSMAMTAEALACRLFLGLPPDHPAAVEALDVLARSPPLRESHNAYAWYYATLASFHAGGPQWDRWNERLQVALLPLQHRAAGSLAGSWDPDPVWGGHGGRVYSTALSAMTLEVYYRHQPLHRRPVKALAALP